MTGGGRIENKVKINHMKYTVKPLISAGCDCENCKAGRHLYSLNRWTDNGWEEVGFSLESYLNAEECQRKHYWGIRIAPGDTWADGTPVVEPPSETSPGNGETVELDQAAA